MKHAHTLSQHATIIFPHQLYQTHPAVQAGRLVVLVEEYLFFDQYRFHQKKLVLHRASMQYYCQHLKQQQLKVLYVEAAQNNQVQQVVHMLQSKAINTLHVADPVDDWLKRHLQKAAAANGMKLVIYPSPNFLNTLEAGKFFDNRKRYFQTDFYTWQRRQRNILLTADGGPVGGKWSFDDENRAPVKKGEQIPAVIFPAENEYIKEARQYVSKKYPHNYGTSDTLAGGFYPTTFSEANDWLNNFIEQRFARFGVYEDAMVAGEHFLFHSVLTPMLNIGLLQPGQVLQAVLAAAPKHNIPINSLEGFTRQIMGWREFIRLVYEREGRRQRTRNFWGFHRPIPKSFWTGTTGIIPVDDVIGKVLQTGYCHHIERLMVLGNFMLLCEFDPNEVYRWFMEMFVDAYDWVMVPNVYGMTQFADGGLMTTKPYISGSNYLVKMGKFAKGHWQQVWDGLFWRFMHVHRDMFAKNPRLSMLLNTWDNMDPAKKNMHLLQADNFLQYLHHTP